MRLFLPAILLLVSGCVTEIVEPPARGDFDVLEWPSDLDDAFLNAGTYHNVRLLFEINPQEDIPGDKDTYRSMVQPVGDGDREVYRVFDLHEVAYSHGQFEVGGYRYRPPTKLRAGAPAARRTRSQYRLGTSASLYMFKRRHGDLEFKFRTQSVLVKTRGDWRPSIYHEQQRGSDGSGQWLHEKLQIGLTTIETDSREKTWFIDGEPHLPSPNRVLELEGAVHFDRSSVIGHR